MSASCLKCGKSTERVVEFYGLLAGNVSVCDECLDPALEEFAERQRQFQELIDAGCPRASANMIMIGRIDAAARERN